MLELNKAVLFLTLMVLIWSCQSTQTSKDETNPPARQLAQKQLTQWVNPMIGTGGHGHTYPGAATPFGMVQLSPDTDHWDWDHCSGYHHDDSTIMGFSHTHHTGTGVGDYGDVLIMPLSGRPAVKPGHKHRPNKGWRSRFSHSTEKAQPGYYSVVLQDYGITAELTATPRCGFHRYTYSRPDSNFFVIDLSHTVQGWKGQTVTAFAQLEDSITISGYQVTNGWAKNQTVYFYIKTSVSAQNVSFVNDTTRYYNDYLADACKLKIIAQVEPNGKLLLLKVGISAVSIENAKENLLHEIPNWDFDDVKNQAVKSWNTILNGVHITAPDPVKNIFYTGLYHASLVPSLFMDVNNQYRGVDRKVHTADGFTKLNTFSLWDTYRATHPWYTITMPHKVNDMVRSMLSHYQHNPYGILPVWSFWGYETWCMIGYHSAPVIADAFLKGIRGYDYDLAMQAMVASATTNYLDYGLNHYMDKGYVAIDQEIEAASKTLEYAYDDYCIARMAEALGRDSLQNIFDKRSQNYKNLYDPQTRFMRAKKTNGQFREPFDPFFIKYKSDYTEGNAWQYTWSVQHDIPGLMALMGGPAGFISKLDSLFTISAPVSKEKSNVRDVTGLIGQYAHGNEPSHHVAYAYVYAGQPWKTQAMVHKICNEQYSNGPDGYSGNEDCGQMSAWYLFSALGFYPVNPCGGVYIIGKPMVEGATFNLPNGNKFYIEVENYNPEYQYVKSATLNGQPLTRPYLLHSEIVNGGKLMFELSRQPNKQLWNQPITQPIAVRAE